jgi:DNA helicase II / ATP-dependent DNA helicase PcrA
MVTNETATGTLEGIGGRDHEATCEYRIFGPPGTGKTTNLTRQIRRAVDRYGAESLLITSFSRAAAAELAGRDLPVSHDRIGTLHSHCWHALGGPKIAEANAEEWNREHPDLAITPQKQQRRLEGDEAVEDGGDEDRADKNGDQLLQQLSRFRGMLLPRHAWPLVTAQFEKLWTAHKEANGLLDFTDLIDVCRRDVAIAPRNPSVIFADEAQDLNPMQLSLVRKWGERAEYFIVAGDDDQTIYAFSGASPEAMLDPDIPSDHKIILKQSYRVPRAVHELAEGLIRTVTRRQEKVYLPRAEDGAVERLSRDGYKRIEISILDEAMGYANQRKSVMFLASCSYMLRPVVAALRAAGVPFHNPYRHSNGAWNPLRPGKHGSTAGRILSLLIGHPEFGEGHRPWTNGDLAQWAEVLQAKGVLRRGMKTRLNQGDLDQPATIERLDEVFEPAALDSLMAAWDTGSTALSRWWRERLVADVYDRARYPAEIVAARGPHALVETPRIIVGTIHSVKGGQADVVYLFPDLSQAADQHYASEGAARDSVIRVFYVGMTRARERLCICHQETPLAIAI